MNESIELIGAVDFYMGDMLARKLDAPIFVIVLRCGGHLAVLAWIICWQYRCLCSVSFFRQCMSPEADL